MLELRDAVEGGDRLLLEVHLVDLPRPEDQAGKALAPIRREAGPERDADPSLHVVYAASPMFFTWTTAVSSSTPNAIFAVMAYWSVRE